RFSMARPAGKAENRVPDCTKRATFCCRDAKLYRCAARCRRGGYSTARRGVRRRSAVRRRRGADWAWEPAGRPAPPGPLKGLSVGTSPRGSNTRRPPPPPQPLAVQFSELVLVISIPDVMHLLQFGD